MNISKAFFFCSNGRLLSDRLIALTFLCMVISGVVSIGHYNYMPVLFVLEALFLLLILPITGRISTQNSIIEFGLFTYLFFYVTLSIAFGSNFFDLLLSVKFLFYGILLSALRVGNISASTRFQDLVPWLFWFFLAALTFKYSYHVFLGISDRPGLLTENNFELMFFLCLFILTASLRPMYIYELILVFFVVAISGSRSAALGLVVVVLILNIKVQGPAKKFSALIKPVMVFICIGAFFFVFLSRLGGFSISSFDRFFFLLRFLDEVEYRGWFNFIFGSGLLTPLQDQVCADLDYYKSLFSFSGDGSCYSVIFHSAMMRILIDHGILLFLIFLYHIYFLLKGSIGIRNSTAFVALIIVNSLSVSSVFSVFFAWAFFLALKCRSVDAA